MASVPAGSRGIVARNLLLSGGLEELAFACHEAGIKIILLKGAALFVLGLAEFDEREMTDIDILVRTEDESRLESLLLSLGYSHMENSSQAFIRNEECGMRNVECDILNPKIRTLESEIRNPKSEICNFRADILNSEFPTPHSALRMPPVIIDVHAQLRHLEDISGIFNEAVNVKTESSEFSVLNPEEMLIHVSSHSMLHHGCLLDKTIEDIKKIAELGIVNPKSEIPNPKSQILNPKCEFLDWEGVVDKSEKYRLGGLMHCVLTEAKNAGAAVPKEILKLIKPEGVMSLFLPFFKKAAKSRHPVRFLEYLLPVLVRPSLFRRYAFPDKEFLEKRYGSSSFLNILLRPLRILRNSLKS